MTCSDRSTPAAIAMCTNPDGLHEHVAADTLVNGQCFADCACTPRIYVAADVLLSAEAIDAIDEIYGRPMNHWPPGTTDSDITRASLREAISLFSPGSQS